MFIMIQHVYFDTRITTQTSAPISVHAVMENLEKECNLDG